MSEQEMVIKLRWEYLSPLHIKCTLFSGPPGRTMANIGELTMRHDEAIRFRNTVRQGIQGDGFTGILEQGWTTEVSDEAVG